MAEQDFPFIHQDIQINVERGGEKQTLLARILDFDDDTLTIDAPPEDVLEDAVEVGEKVEVIAALEGGLYSFASTIREAKEVEGAPALVLDRASGLQKVQRRRFFRIRAEVAVSFRLCDEPGGPWHDAITKDISGGGVLMTTGKPVDVEKRIELKIELPNATAEAVGRIVTTRESEDPGKIDVAAEFVDISKEQRDRIFEFVLEQQTTEPDESQE